MRSLRARDATHLLAQIDRKLSREYGDKEALLGNKLDPLDEAIYIILSFQTDTPRLRAQWKKLRAEYPTWDQLEAAPLYSIAATLRLGGLHRQKARTIRALIRRVRSFGQGLSLDSLHSLS